VRLPIAGTPSAQEEEGSLVLLSTGKVHFLELFQLTGISGRARTTVLIQSEADEESFAERKQKTGSL
jgi:hypothetical protein